jgi:hypothetical protein
METEPTEEGRQRQAFLLLRSKARNAHIAGDGLLVGVLCHTGLDQVRKLAKEKKLLLSISDLYWLWIFALYWLVNPSERYVIEETLKLLKHDTDEDRAVAQWIDRYRIVIENPLLGDAQLEPVLTEFAWPVHFMERSPETESLVANLVELAWYQGPMDDNWKQLVDVWLQAGPVWAHPLLAALKKRMDVQARLTTPNKPHDLLPESEREKLRAHYEIAELWLLHLYGRSAEVCETAERLTPFLSAESHRWRVLHDFIHFDTRYEPSEDSQGVRLARRRRLSVETPLFIFHDERGSQLTRLLLGLFRAGSEGEASKRRDILILARLHELAALRVWDYGMWLEAIRDQAQTNLELVQWADNQPGLGAQGLILAVRSFSVGSPEKDAVIRHAIDILEFAPTEVLLLLAESLLATYPKQKYSAQSLFADLIDVLPPAAWPKLAHWTMSYALESTEGRTGGWHLAPATCWQWVLPVLPPDSLVWSTLQPEVMRMARLGPCWDGDYGKLLKVWLLFGAPPLAREVAEAMTTHSETAPRECFARAELLISFEEWNPNLRGVYTRRLLPSSHSASEALVLAKHLEELDVTVREGTLRERVTQQVRETITLVTSQSDMLPLGFLPASGVHLVTHWRPEDCSLLEELVAAVNSPNVLTDYIAWLLSIIQLMVAHGPVEFSQFVQPYIAQWTRQLPRGRKTTTGGRGPLSIMQWSGPGEGEIGLMLGWLAFQLPQKLGAESHAVVLTWARQMLLIGESRPLDMAIYGSAVVALQMPDATAAEPLALMETAILSLSGRVDVDPSAVQSLADALRRVSSLLDSKLSEDAESASSPSSAGVFIAVLSRLIPRFATSPRALLRAAVAAVVWQLQKHGRCDEWVTKSLKTLQEDNRARVRFEAHGGWKEARTRADARFNQ